MAAPLKGDRARPVADVPLRLRRSVTPRLAHPTHLAFRTSLLPSFSYLKNDTFSVQHDIVNHVEYTIGRTRYRFDDFEAYQARSHKTPRLVLPRAPVPAARPLSVCAARV